MGSISDAKVLELCHRDPSFGLYLMRLVIKRMLVGERRRMGREPVSIGPSVDGPFVDVSASRRLSAREHRPL
jgi:hypothetical protein